MGSPRWGWRSSGGHRRARLLPAGQSRQRQKSGQHLSLLARPPLFSAEAAAAANCHGHQVTGSRRRPLRAWRGRGGRRVKGAEERGGGAQREG